MFVGGTTSRCLPAGRDEVFWLSKCQFEFLVVLHARLHDQRIFRISVASHLTSTMAEITSLESAKRKLEENDFPFKNLPINPTGTFWFNIRDECRLTLPELFALMNATAGTTSKCFYSISLFVDSYCYILLLPDSYKLSSASYTVDILYIFFIIHSNR